MSIKRAKIFTPKNPVKLKAKLGGPYAVDFNTLERAEEAIAAMTPQYLDWVKKDLANIEAFYKELRSSDNKSKETLNHIFLVAHDMKGQGGTFGFDLITTIGDQLCRIIDKIELIRDEELETIEVHIDAMKLVIKDKMVGDGGTDGAKMLKGLGKVSRKILN